MRYSLLRSLVLLIGILFYESANAWFFFWIPTGAIQKSLETDPDSIVVSEGDRDLGKCAGFHLNQAQKGMGSPSYGQERFPGAPPPAEPAQTPESKFHSDMADVALHMARDQDSVRKLAEAYSVRWSRVAGADLQANRQYGMNLVRGCVGNDIAIQFSDYSSWKARREEKARQQAEQERMRMQREEEDRRAKAEEDRKRAIEEEQRRSARNTAQVPTSGQRSPWANINGSSVDYISEAKKSAKILGCVTDDVRITGAEQNNVLAAANCSNGQPLLLSCDQTGLCLKR